MGSRVKGRAPAAELTSGAGAATPPCFPDKRRRNPEDEKLGTALCGFLRCGDTVEELQKKFREHIQTEKNKRRHQQQP